MSTLTFDSMTLHSFFHDQKRVKLCYYSCNLYCDQFRNPNYLAGFQSAFKLALSQLMFPHDAAGRQQRAEHRKWPELREWSATENRSNDLVLYKMFSIAAEF